MLVTLENGLRVILQENHSAPVVALQMWLNAGSADDPDDMAGLAHLLEHMVFKGTARRGVGDIAQEIEGAGGDINAWTSFDQTVYHIVMASRFFDRGLDVLSDALQHSQVDANELSKEIQVVLEEIKEGEDAPGKVVSRDLFASAYRKHRYGRPVIGYASAVQQMTAERIAGYFRAWYRPENMVLAIVGDVDRTVLSRVKKAFSRWGKRESPADEMTLATIRRNRQQEPKQRKLRVKVRNLSSKEAHLGIAFHIPEFVHDDTPALDLAAIILGQGGASRLARRVRHDLQVVTDVYAYAYTPKDSGLLIVGATMPIEKLSKATAAISRELFALCQAEVTAGELSRAQTIIESDTIYQKETVQGQARKLGFFQSVADDLSFEAEYTRRVAAVTPAALQEVAARYIKPSNMTVSVVVPKGKAKLAQQLRSTVEHAASAAAKRGPAKREITTKATKITLRNGARLVFVRDTTVPLVAMRAVWMGGLRYENPRNNGINNLLAALVTRGTTTRSGEEIDAEIEGMAGAIGGFSGRNSFGLRAELLSRYWERGLEILVDCARNPAFAQDEVERQRREVLEEIRGRQDNIVSVAMRLFSSTLYQRHPYRLDALGTHQSVQSLTRQQLQRYYRRYFDVSQMVLAVVGDIDPQQLVAKFDQLIGDRPRVRNRAKPSLSREQILPSRAAMLPADKEQAHVIVGYPGVTMRSKDRYALDVLATLLGGQGGRLFVELRDRQGLAYRVSAFSIEGIEPGYIAAYMATSPSKIEQALSGFEQEFEKVRRDRITRAELDRIKRYLVGAHDISLQRKSTVASFLAFNEVYGLGHDMHLRFAEGIMGVTADDVRRVARRYLSPKRRVVTIVHPEELSPGALERLGLPVAGVAKTAADPKKSKKSKKKKK